MTIHKEVLELAFKTHSNNERHRTLAETRYWCDQYKLLAKTAIEALAQQSNKQIEPPLWWPAVENILNEYGLQAIDFVADFKRALTQPDQKPVAWMCHPFGDDECEFSDHQECENCIPLYTTSPQRKPLTEDEAVSAVSSVLPVTSTGGQTHHLQIQHKHALEITRAVEAAHGIKEST